MKKFNLILIAMAIAVILCTYGQNTTAPEVEEPLPIVVEEPVEEKSESYSQIVKGKTGYESLLLYDEVYESEADVEAAIRNAELDYLPVEIIVNTLNPFYTATYEALNYLGFKTSEFQDAELVDFSIEYYAEEVHTTLCGRITTSEGEVFKAILSVHFYADDIVWGPIMIIDETIDTQYQYDYYENIFYYDESGDYWDVNRECYSFDIE